MALLALYWSTQVCMRPLPALSLAYFVSIAFGKTAGPLGMAGVAAGAGALLDVGTHAIDAARFLCGDVEEVAGAMTAISIRERKLPAGATVGHNRVELSDESRTVDNDDVASALDAYPSARVRIEGHSGRVGRPAVNRALAATRARATRVNRWLAVVIPPTGQRDEWPSGFRRSILTRAAAAQWVRDFRPRIVYPYHYRNRDGSKSDIDWFKTLVGNASEVRLRNWY